MSLETVSVTIEPAEHPEGWAFEQAERNYNERRADTWVEVSSEFADYCLNVLPPIYRSGGFMVSEPYTHTEEGRSVHTGIVRVGDRCFATVGTVRQFDEWAKNLRDFLAPHRASRA